MSIEEERSFLLRLSENRWESLPRKSFSDQALHIGMTAKQVLDAFGPPIARDIKQMRTKMVETYKYCKESRGFRLKVIIENGAVVAWEDRRFA